MSKPSLIFISALLLFNVNLYAQIATDGSLGPPARNLQGPNYQIGDNLGQQNGTNLFHSFQEFNLHRLESATFSGPNDIQNVISRVTGGNPSNIDGTIRSLIPNADFYFLNPYGIVFGPNARLDVPGSFHASTAHYLRLGENERFYSDLGNQSILSVASPAAFGFLGKPESITIRDGYLKVGNFLEPDKEKTLSITGGDLLIEDGTLFAPNGQIYLVSVASEGEITFTSPNSLTHSFDRLVHCQSNFVGL